MKRRAATLDRPPAGALQQASAEVLAELVHHATLADEHYRAAAEQIGLLYMSADAHRLVALTRRLDEPMRRAAEVERDFAGLMRELQACAARRSGVR